MRMNRRTFLQSTAARYESRRHLEGGRRVLAQGATDRPGGGGGDSSAAAPVPASIRALKPMTPESFRSR
jgi:hypothetical protein